MDSDTQSLMTRVVQLLSAVETDSEKVAKQALILLREIEAKPDPDAEVLALTFRCYGLALRGCGRIQEALIWLERSVNSALAGDLQSIAALSRLALASCLSMTGDFDAALQQTEKALPLLSAVEVAAALSRRAIFLQRLERTADAGVAYEEAIARALADDQVLVLAKALNNRGLFRVDLGEMKNAAADLLASSKLFLELGLVDTSASIDHNLGWCFARQGLVVEALDAYARSDVKGGLGSSATWEGAFDRAEVYVSARLLPEALHSATHALRLARQAGFESEVPVITFQLGRIQATLGDVLAAEKCFAIVQDRFQDQGRHVSAAAAQICRVLVSNESPPEQTLQAPSATSDDDPHGYRDTVVDVAYGELLRMRFRSQPASTEKLVWIQSQLEPRLSSSNSLTRVQAYAARILMLGTGGSFGGALHDGLLHAARDLFEELERHLDGIHSHELRTVVVDKLELEALFCMAALSIGDPAIFGLWINRLRSAVTTPTQRTPSTSSISSTEPETQERETQEQKAIEPVDLKNLRHSSGGPQRNALEFAVRTTNWMAKSERSVVENPSAHPSFPIAPGTGQVYLVYAQNSTNLVVSIITENSETIEILGSLKDIRTRSESVCLGAAALFGSNNMGAQATEQRAGSVIRAVDRLESLVLPASLPPGNLLISATGVLGSVPWNLFSRLAGRPVVLTSSLQRSSLAAATQPAWIEGIRVAVVEGPDLEHASREVGAVAALYRDPIVLQGSEATVEAVSDLMTSVDLLHVAAHGHRRTDNALFSGIELFDGPFMAYDIERLSKTPKTVVLSCCDLGAANSQGAFGLLGFSGALVSRGSLQVAGALLPVSDQMSLPVMVRLHTAIISGLSVAQALSEAVANADEQFQRVTAGSYVVKGP